MEIRNEAERTFFEQLGRSFWLRMSSRSSWDDAQCDYYSAYTKKREKESCQNSNDVICEVASGKTSVKSPSHVMAEHKYKLFFERTNKDFKEITDKLDRSAISAWNSGPKKDSPEILELKAKQDAVRETLEEMRAQVLRVYNASMILDW